MPNDVKTFSQFAPAKINLYLEVGTPREDALHPIDSLAVFAKDIGDRVSVSPGRGLTLTITGRFGSTLASDHNNLVLRAAKSLATAFSINTHEHGAAIHLEKNLPIASGIGGGSSDAAATLKALAKLWDLPTDGNLSAIARTLGADVPACLAANPVLMRGVGDAVLPAHCPVGLAILLYNDGIEVSTPSVYRRFDQIGLGASFNEKEPPAPNCDPADFISRICERRNDLEYPAIDLAPSIKDSIELMRSLPGCKLARMSGSGGTVFGIFHSEHEAHAAIETINALRANVWLAAGSIGGSISEH